MERKKRRVIYICLGICLLLVGGGAFWISPYWDEMEYLGEGYYKCNEQNVNSGSYYETDLYEYEIYCDITIESGVALIMIYKTNLDDPIMMKETEQNENLVDSITVSRTERIWIDLNQYEEGLDYYVTVINDGSQKNKYQYELHEKIYQSKRNIVKTRIYQWLDTWR